VLVKKFETNAQIRIHDSEGKIIYHGSYFTSQKFGEMTATEYGILVKEQVIPYAHILCFTADLPAETSKQKKSKKPDRELERSAVSVSETTEST